MADEEAVAGRYQKGIEQLALQGDDKRCSRPDGNLEWTVTRSDL